MRELKYHEKKLLRKVDLYSWKKEDQIRVGAVMRKYQIQRREDYIAYQRICGMITSLTSKLKQLQPDNTFRIAMTDQLLNKLYSMGVISTTKSLELVDSLHVSNFCRRRLPVLMVRYRMSQDLKTAITFIEQGQVRVGPNVITDPAFLVTRPLEDYITWVDQSKIRRTVQRYNNKLDDFDLL